MWQGLHKFGRKSRRRSWWALEVFDKCVFFTSMILLHSCGQPTLWLLVRYAAIAFRQPCSIDDSDCSVDLVTDIRLNKEVIPRQAPLLGYHKWKFKLHHIMGPFLGRQLKTRLLEIVRNIHNQLISWESQLPDGIRLETYQDDGTSGQPPSSANASTCPSIDLSRLFFIEVLPLRTAEMMLTWMVQQFITRVPLFPASSFSNLHYGLPSYTATIGFCWPVIGHMRQCISGSVYSQLVLSCVR